MARTRWSDERAMHDDLYAQLRCGTGVRNLDAFDDNLSELVIADPGRVLVFERYDHFAARLRRVAQDLLDIIAIQARTHLLFGSRLIALIQSDDRELSIDPVGAMPVISPRL